jgi:hypothetical protein
MFINPSGSVGIGTTNPTGKLMLYQSSAGNVFQNIVSNQGSSTQAGINFSPSMTDTEVAANPAQASIYATDSNYGANIIFATKATGAVGNALTTRLTIASTGAATFSSSVTTTGGSQPSPNGLHYYFSSNVGYIESLQAGVAWRDLSINANDLIFKSGGIERMRINSSGNVGIGTASPVSIGGYTALTLNGTSGSFIEYQQSGSYSFRVGSDNSLGGFISQTDANPIRIFTNSNERMRITSGGNVLIGTTTDNGEKLQVAGSVNMFNYTSFTTSTKTAASNVNIAFDLTADYGRGGGDNIGGLVVININQTSASTSEPNAAYVGIVINPRGAGGSISQISRLLGAGVSALSVFMSGNSILVNAVLTSGGTYRASLTFIGGGGTS